ncbi:hypothetical protein M8C21_028059, partial [Ambrosia artemisiifolia]
TKLSSSSASQHTCSSLNQTNKTSVFLSRSSLNHTSPRTLTIAAAGTLTIAAAIINRTLNLPWSTETFISVGIPDMVFRWWALSLKVCSMFDCVKRGRNRRFVSNRGGEIDYDSLALGRLDEVRDILGIVVFNTVYPIQLATQ